MPNEFAFRTAAALLIILIMSIRIYYHLSARQLRGVFARHEPRGQIIFKSGMAIFSFMMLTLYIIYPVPITRWSIFLPGWLRWSGVATGLLAAAMHGFSLHALAENFSPFLHLRQQHTLVTHGPYRWIRHPLYTALYLTSLTWFLLSANALVGVFWLGFVLIVTWQVTTEEAMLLKKFGNEYRRYIQSTGRFLPRFFPWRTP